MSGGITLLEKWRAAGVGARSAEVSRAFQLPSGGGSHAAGMRSLDPRLTA